MLMGRWASQTTYEDVKHAADDNGRSAETLDVMERTTAKDRTEHAQEYAPAPRRS
jgi:hypothetical protein